MACEFDPIFDYAEIVASHVTTGDPPGFRTAYFIGATPPLTSQSLGDLTLAARTIIARRSPADVPPQDALPGINLEPETKALADAIGDYFANDKAQCEPEAQKVGCLEQANLDKKQALAWARESQAATAQAWPWCKLGVKTSRAKFCLPERQRLVSKMTSPEAGCTSVAPDSLSSVWLASTTASK